MENSTNEKWEEISEGGICFEPGSIFKQLIKIQDPRMARGKRYSIAIILTLLITAKLCGEDTPVATADWANNRAEKIVKKLHLAYPQLPHHSTYRRILEIIVETELEEKVREHLKGLKKEKGGNVVALDGKALRGTRESDEQRGDHMLAVYLPVQELVMAQVAVENKENEIVAAPKLLKAINMTGKILTADAMHT